MRRQVQTVCYLLAFLSLLGGMADIGIQFYEGHEIIQWRIPLILIGFGVGFPAIIFPFHLPAEDNSADYDENDLSSVYQNGNGFLSGMGSESDSEYDDYESSGGSDDDSD